MPQYNYPHVPPIHLPQQAQTQPQPSPLPLPKETKPNPEPGHHLYADPQTFTDSASGQSYTTLKILIPKGDFLTKQKNNHFTKPTQSSQPFLLPESTSPSQLPQAAPVYQVRLPQQVVSIIAKVVGFESYKLIA